MKKMLPVALGLGIGACALIFPLFAQQQTKTPLDGEWTQAADGSGFKVVFAGDKASFIKASGVVESESKFTVRADKKPAEIDIHVDKSGKKFTVPGIYKVEKKGTQLTIAYSTLRDGAVRPTEYVGGGDNEVRVYVLHRKKEK